MRERKVKQVCSYSVILCICYFWQLPDDCFTKEHETPSSSKCFQPDDPLCGSAHRSCLTIDSCEIFNSLYYCIFDVQGVMTSFLEFIVIRLS